MTLVIAKTNLTNLWEWVKATQNTGGRHHGKDYHISPGYCSANRVRHADQAEGSTPIDVLINPKKM
jgi:hypothetical protein